MLTTARAPDLLYLMDAGILRFGRTGRIF